MRAILTVLGKDRRGIIAGVSSLLAEYDVNILDISQTILQEYFTMILLADLTACPLSLAQMQDKLTSLGVELGLEIRLQHEDIFNSMHRI